MRTYKMSLSSCKDIFELATSYTMSETKPEAKAAIVPHKKGLYDVCGDDNGNVYIIRSDLLCYLKCRHNLEYHSGEKSQKYTLFPLHPSCSGGDYYIKDQVGFTIIKNSTFFTVSDLTTPVGTNVEGKPLSPFCQRLCNSATAVVRFRQSYYIIQGDSYTIVSSLTSSLSSQEGVKLYARLANALYYYTFRAGNNEYLGVITQNDNAVIYWRTDDLKENRGGQSRFIYPNLVNFFPGGYSINYGIASSNWELLKCFRNESNTTLNWSEDITKTVGYKKSEFESLEHNWNITAEVSMGTSFEVGFLVPATIEMQFSLSTSYGGAMINTKQEDWSEEKITTEQLSLEIKPGKKVYIWQYRLGFSGQPNSLLYCRDLAMTNSNSPPLKLPLMPSQSSK